MKTRFLQSGLWRELTARAKRAKRAHVAVAYLGRDASRLLPLRKGDILVTDLRLETVRAGQVDPSEVVIFLKKGVEVFSCANLHAKTFVFDEVALVGSANISKRSRDILIEGGIITGDTETVSAVRGFVLSLTHEPVTPAFARALKKEYRPPRNLPGGKATRREAETVVWVEGITPTDFDSVENKIAEAGKKIARKKVKNKRRHSIEVVRYGARAGIGKRGRVGDFVVQIQKEDDGAHKVYPPSRIVKVRRFVNAKGASRVLVFTEEPRNPLLRDWRQIASLLRRHRVTRVSTNMDRGIVNTQAVQALLGSWPLGTHEK